jgi:hypothetical protein
MRHGDDHAPSGPRSCERGSARKRLAQSRVRKNAEGGRLTVTADMPDVYCSRPRHFGIPAKRSPSTAAGPAAVDRRRRASPRRRPRALRSAFLRTRLCAQAACAEPRSQERGRRALDRHGRRARRLLLAPAALRHSRESQPFHGSRPPQQSTVAGGRAHGDDHAPSGPRSCERGSARKRLARTERT